MSQSRRATWARVTTAMAVIAFGWVAMTSAQRRGFGGFGMVYTPNTHNSKYDGRFTFVRLKFAHGPAGYYYHGLPAWAHGLEPGEGNNAEDNLNKILDAISVVHPRMDGSNVFGLDDPELFKYPICYMTEAGFWELTDKEAAEFRLYLEKGGFVIFDDFREGRGSGGWDQFEYNMRRILPQAQILDMDPHDPIFHVFFDIDSFDLIKQSYDKGVPVLRGIFEGNDKKNRQMAMINYSTDISDYWEFSSTGFAPVSDANEAFELGVNYMIYGLTH